MGKFTALNLESLEDRMVPANLSLMFRGAVSADWNTAGNWVNGATGVVAVNPPDSLDRCYFDAMSPPFTKVSGSGVCKQLDVSALYNGTIEIAGSLTVFGAAAGAGVSAIRNGTISSSNDNAVFELVGGNLQYSATSLNNVAGAKWLYVRASQDNLAGGAEGTISFVGGFTNLNHTVLQAGSNLFNKVGNINMLALTNPVNATNGSCLYVENTGEFNVSQDVSGIEINLDDGNMIFTNTCTLSLSVGMDVKNGSSITTTDVGLCKINGSVYFADSTLDMGVTPNMCSRFQVTSALDFVRSEVHWDVDGSIVGNGIPSIDQDYIFADLISFDNASTSDCYTYGFAWGPHSYEVMSATNLMLNGFANYNWLGTDPTAWTPVYANNKLTWIGNFNPNLQVNGDAWLDVNHNGIHEGGEGALAGVGVSLYNQYGTLISSQTTNSSGHYSFGGLAIGTYYVVFTDVNNYLTPHISPADQGGNDNIDSDVTTILFSDPHTIVGRTNNFTIAANLDHLDIGLWF